MKLENLLSENVNQQWLTYAEDNDLLLKRSSTSERYKGFIKFLDKCYRQADWQITKNESLPAHVKTKYSFVSSSQFSQSFLINSKAEDSDNESIEEKPVQKILPKHPCLVCSKDGCTDETVTRHYMGSCDVWKSLSHVDKLKYVTCTLHPFAKHIKFDPEHCKGPTTICRICHKENDHHTLLCNFKTTKSNKTSLSSSNVMLKTMYVPTADQSLRIGVMEDNCSTDSFVTFKIAKLLGLEGDDINLEVEGINTTEQIKSKVYKVPIRDKGGNIHKIECYGLKEITKASSQPNNDYNRICKSFNISPCQIQRPDDIHLLLSAKDNHLMSDRVVMEKNGLKLYSGPLGQTISGNTEQFRSEHIKAFPTKTKPVTQISSTVKLAKVNVKLDGFNDVENSSNSVTESPTGGATPPIKTEANVEANVHLTSSLTSSVSASSTSGPENDVLDSSISGTILDSSAGVSASSASGPESVIHSTTLPTSSSPGDGAVVECRRISPAEAICPRPPGEGKVANIDVVLEKGPPQQQNEFRNFSKLNFAKVQPLPKFSPMFSTFPCSRPKPQTSHDLQNVPVSKPNVKIDVKTNEKFVKLAHGSHDYKEKGTVKKKSNQIQSMSLQGKHLPMERTFVSDGKIAIGEDCRIDSPTTSSNKYLNCTQLFENRFYHELQQINPIKF